MKKISNEVIEKQIDEYLFERSNTRRGNAIKFGCGFFGVVSIYMLGILYGQKDMTIVTDTRTEYIMQTEYVETVKGVRMSDIDAMSFTIWGESKLQPYEGQLAVAHTIKNRKRFDETCDSISEVVKEPFQFSIWNKTDPSYNLVTDLTINPHKIIEDDKMRKQHAISWKIAYDVLTGDSKDPTNGATMYLNPKVVKKIPDWFKVCENTIQIGDHHFCYYDGNFCDR